MLHLLCLSLYLKVVFLLVALGIGSILSVYSIIYSCVLCVVLTDLLTDLIWVLTTVFLSFIFSVGGFNYIFGFADNISIFKVVSVLVTAYF